MRETSLEELGNLIREADQTIEGPCLTYTGINDEHFHTFWKGERRLHLDWEWPFLGYQLLGKFVPIVAWPLFPLFLSMLMIYRFRNRGGLQGPSFLCGRRVVVELTEWTEGQGRTAIQTYYLSTEQSLLTIARHWLCEKCPLDSLERMEQMEDGSWMDEVYCRERGRARE